MQFGQRDGINAQPENGHSVHIERIFAQQCGGRQRKSDVSCGVRSRKCSDDVNRYKYLHLVIPEKNVLLVLPNGTTKNICNDSDKALEIGCRIFNVNRIEPLLPV